MAIGLTMIVQGGIFLADVRHLTLGAAAAGLLTAASGALLLVGFLTPVAGTLSGLAALCIALGWVPPTIAGLFDARVPALRVGIISIAIVLLGPGAISIDARLFGRREIIIPPVSRTPR